MNLKTYATNICDPKFEEFLSSLNWKKSNSPKVYFTDIACEGILGWQVALESDFERDNVVLVNDFSEESIAGLLASIANGIEKDVAYELMEDEARLFESLFESRITSYDDFPLNEILSFLSNWKEISEHSEIEKVKYFLLSTLDIEVEVKTYEDFTSSENLVKYSNVLRAHSNNLDLFYCFKDDVEIDGEFKLIFTLLLIYQDQKLEKEKLESYSKSDWEIILNSLSLPTCLVSQRGELVLHNSTFSSLGLYANDCLKLDNGVTIEIQDNIYKVFKDSIRVGGKDFESFVFITNNELKREGNVTISSEELGIISGSIAHELNNPIAGILAALTLLKLEDDLADDSLLILEDMELGAKRCKKLIEVFLGFSRLDPLNSKCDSLESSLEQSLSLLRSRMVESNLKMHIEYRVDDSFKRPLNNSIASMIFYLILNEGFTLGHHQKLLINDLNQIDVSVIEREHEMSFSFSPEIKLYEQLQNSKLFLHLLNILNIEILTREGRIYLRSYDN
ncbi:histidine kinase dimerization/phospho-acceptor domain-containing protein [Halobacteriovorax sp. HLS]|uniref:histidine kinase dimerization/phospho-acceptor domain-containing protein n=1 Tax=Halobacteriovorax sp. HLS TaxID=2234000 RepID=UPI000FD980F5|nr:histidine kinase dimerization/phospho-acceptor domain-containing protein [Halobacteriovorax sp. HLS]